MLLKMIEVFFLKLCFGYRLCPSSENLLRKLLQFSSTTFFFFIFNFFLYINKVLLLYVLTANETNETVTKLYLTFRTNNEAREFYK